ncbi:MAG: PilZ domain-containing protein [Acidobacteriia bacterium]|nr:PilZ domain-containing protein [Terriglobia bacterium]
MGDRRFETRRPALEPVALVWTAAAAEHQDTGTLRDVSRSGARIHLEHPVPVNTSVRATIRGVAVTAQVRSCARKAPGFIIGLEFDPEFQGKVRTRPA